MEIKTRPMLAKDYDKVLKLWKKSFKKIYLQDSRRALEKILEKNPDSCLVAVSGSRIIGTILGLYDSRFAYFYRLAVDPDFRGRGISLRLMDESGKVLKKQGAIEVIFCLRREKLLEYYRKAGYRKTNYCLMVRGL